MGTDLLIIILFLAIAMAAIHIFFNPIIRKKRKKPDKELPKISYRRPYSTRRKRYKNKL
jgi:NADH:ubiquinone oxidoreductase subunit 3 (subunit A)